MTSTVEPVSSPQGKFAPGPEKPRLVDLDILRVLGAIAIVAIHIADDGISAFGDISHAKWLYCLAIDSAMRWAVPIFVMVSGFLLLDPSRVETPSIFFRKRLRRIGIPVVFWSVFYLVWRRYFGAGDNMSLGYAIQQGLTGAAYYHLWFVFMLLGLYLATPALRIFTRNAPVAFQRWTALGLLGLGCLDLLSSSGNSSVTVFMQWAPFVGYYIAGTAFSAVRVSRTVAAALVVVIPTSIIAMVLIAARITMRVGDADSGGYLLDEMSPFAIAMSLSVFLLVRKWLGGVSDGKFARLVTVYLAPATLGVYLIHPVFLDLLQAWGLDYDWHGIWIGVPVRIVAATTLSFVAALILIRIPVIKSTVGG